MKNFTPRAFVVGLAGLVVITGSSCYVALKMGALPWPTVFVTVLALAALKNAKNSTVQEINISHTLMSSGAMVAGGLAFTLPGLWIINPNAQISVLSVFVFTSIGALLGTCFSALYRKTLLEDGTLVFPIGKSAYNTLVSGIEESKQSVKLFVSMGISIVFTVLRDAFALFPSVVSNQNIGFWLSPMALSIGAMIDKVSSLLWLLGAVIGIFISSTVIKQSLGIGILLGTGLGILLKSLISVFKAKKSKNSMDSKKLYFVLVAAVFSTIMLTSLTDLNYFQSILTVLGISLVSLLSGMLTGQSGINPMEVFGILVMLGISFVSKLEQNSMFIIAGTTAVACGLCGDVMNDLKSGQMLGTNANAQLFAELIGALVGALVAVVSLFAMKNVFGSFGTDSLPSPQAIAVATMAGGFGDFKIILIGIAIGLVLFFFKIPSSTLGLGIYLPNYISFAVSSGALIALALKKFAKTDDNNINIVSSGLLGGEGITGVVIAIISTIAAF